MPVWWRRELAHAAGGYAIASLALHCGAPLHWAWILGALPSIREIWDYYVNRQSKLKTAADTAAWWIGSALAVAIGLEAG